MVPCYHTTHCVSLYSVYHPSWPLHSTSDEKKFSCARLKLNGFGLWLSVVLFHQVSCARLKLNGFGLWLSVVLFHQVSCARLKLNGFGLWLSVVLFHQVSCARLKLNGFGLWLSVVLFHQVSALGFGYQWFSFTKFQLWALVISGSLSPSFSPRCLLSGTTFLITSDTAVFSHSSQLLLKPFRVSLYFSLL